MESDAPSHIEMTPMSTMRRRKDATRIVMVVTGIGTSDDTLD
jgi:hypothetical protein